jgi:hypothetical protein
MRAHRRALAIGVLALGVGAGIAAGVVTIATGRSRTEPAVFARTAKLTASRGAVGNGLSLDGAALLAAKASGKRVLGTLGEGDEIIAPLTGALVPVAALGGDDDFVVYPSWRQLARINPDARGQGLSAGQPVGVPSIRLFDLRSAKDQLLANGAASPAVSTTGAIAYLAGDSQVVRQNVEYLGRIVVADSRDAKPHVWTSKAARYFPYAWAGSQLLVYRGVPDSEGADLFAFTGPDEEHLLAADAFAIAVSPDGAKVLVAVGFRTLEIIRVADGAIEDTLSLDAAQSSATAPHTLMYGGSWRDDRIVAKSDHGLVVLNVHGGLHIESVLSSPDLPHGINEPVLGDETRVQGWADVGKPHSTQSGAGEPAYDNALVDCDLATVSCSVDQPNPARQWARWVTNPSR